MRDFLVLIIMWLLVAILFSINDFKELYRDTNAPAQIEEKH